MSEEKLTYEYPAIEMIDLDILLCRTPAGEGSPILDEDVTRPGEIIGDED